MDFWDMPWEGPVGACPLISPGLPLVSAVAKFVARRWSSQQVKVSTVGRKRHVNLQIASENCLETHPPKKTILKLSNLEG